MPLLHVSPRLYAPSPVSHKNAHCTHGTGLTRRFALHNGLDPPPGGDGLASSTSPTASAYLSREEVAAVRQRARFRAPDPGAAATPHTL